MKVIPGNAQDIGARDSQQDAFGFSNFGDEAFEAHGGMMMVLCDGMGGLAKGADAATAAVNAVLVGYQRKLPSEPIPDALNRVIREAHRAVCEVSDDGAAAGTTVVAAVVCRDRLYWGSLGDSRLYLCRGKDPARQLTEDHNVATLMKARTQRGESSRRDSTTVRDQEALTAYLGAPNPPPPHAGRDGLMLEAGDRIVACSDGLYRGLAPDAIASISRSADPMTAAEHMVEAVLRQNLPHQDNLTVALFEVVPVRRAVAAPDRAIIARTLPVGVGFVAGVLATCMVFLVSLRTFGPAVLQPQAVQAPAAGVAPPAPTTAAAVAPPPAAAPVAPAATTEQPSQPSTSTPGSAEPLPAVGTGTAEETGTDPSQHDPPKSAATGKPNSHTQPAVASGPATDKKGTTAAASQPILPPPPAPPQHQPPPAAETPPKPGMK